MFQLPAVGNEGESRIQESSEHNDMMVAHQ